MAIKRTIANAEKKAPARKPTTRRRKQTAITHDQIAEYAYFLSLQGFSDPLANSLQAERELVGA